MLLRYLVSWKYYWCNYYIFLLYTISILSGWYIGGGCIVLCIYFCNIWIFMFYIYFLAIHGRSNIFNFI